MNKVFSFIIFSVTTCILLACTTHKQKVLPARELAFCDFVLGGSFDECYQNANNSHQYYYLKREKDELLDFASFFSSEIPRYSRPDDTISVLMGRIEAYRDTIYSISYISHATEDILEMYQAKYGIVEPRHWEYDLEDYHNINYGYYWLFENGRINVHEQIREPLHYTLTKHHSISVLYSDYSLSDTAESYKTFLQAKRDSIKQVQADNERLMKEKEEREQARIKEEKQKEIIKSLKF